MTPIAALELNPIKQPKNYSPEADREEYAEHFDDDAPPGRHIEESCFLLHAVLDASLDYLLRGRQAEPWVSWVTLDVPDKCAMVRRALHLDQSRDVQCLHYIHGHLEAVEHYDRERSRLMRLEFESPGAVSLVEKADLADALMSAAMLLEEGMRSEYDDFPYIT